MKIKLASIIVEDQDKALKFYTEVLGFVKKQDIPLGGKFRFLTVVSHEEPEGTQLLLEPNENTASNTFQKAIFEMGVPITAFQVDNIQNEFERLKTLGVVFKMEPTIMGPVTQAILNDTCGNYIQIYQI